MAVKTMNCRDVGLRLQTYLDGELDPDRMQAIHDHLDACVECGLEADVFRRIKADLAGSAPTTDPAVLERLRAFTARIASGDSAEV